MTKIEYVKDGLLIFTRLYSYIIIGRIIMSWFMVGGRGGNPTMDVIYQFFYGVTEPFLAPLRRVIPAIRMGMGYLDLSPIALLILVRILEIIIFRYL